MNSSGSNHKRPASSSRLSPLALPFILNRPNSHSPFHTINSSSPSSSSSSSLSFSHLNLERSDSLLAAPNSFHPPQFPSPSFHSLSDFGALPLPLPVNTPLLPLHDQETTVPSRCKDKDGAFSTSYNNSFDQVKAPAEVLKPFSERSDSFHGKYIAITETKNESRDTKQIESHVSFPTTADLGSTTKYGDPQCGLLHSMTCSVRDSNTKKNFSGPLNSYATKLKVSCVSESHSSPVLVSGQSGISTGDLPHDLLLHQNLDSDRYGALSNDKLFSCNPIIKKEPCTSLNTMNSEVVHQSLIEKGRVEKNDEPLTNEIMDSSTISNTELQVMHPSVPHDLTLKLYGAEEGDSDLDSPCWKGTLAANQSTSGDPESLNLQHLKSGQEELKSLNSLPSHLFISDDKKDTSHSGNECDSDNSSFFLRTASSAVALPSMDQGSAHLITAGSSSSKLTNVIQSHCASDFYLRDKENSLLKDSSSSSTAVSMRGTGHAMHHGSTRISFATKNVFCSSSCRVGVPSDFAEVHGGTTRSFSRPPTLDIQKLVITMNELSELLRENCSNLNSLDEHEHDILKCIINNLTVCIRNRTGTRTLMPQSCCSCTSYYHKNSADLCKCSIMDLQAARTNATRVLHNLGNENGLNKQKSYCTSSNVQGYFSTSKDGGTGKEKCISQDMTKDHAIKDVNPRVFLYKSVWLEAGAAKRSLEA